MSASAIEIEASGEWRTRGLVIVLGISAVILILRSTYAEIFHFWWTFSAYNHCLLIIPISLFLIYEKRTELLAEPPSISWWGGIYFFLNSILWMLGGFFSFAVVQHAAAIGLVVGLVWALIGNSRARIIAFPLLYLYFGVPEGEILVPYLRDLTADVVVNLLRATGIPVYMEGRYLTIPSGQFHVAKACSGINYLIATLAIGTVFAYTRYVSNWRRMAFMGLAILVPLVANGLRAYGIVMIAHLSDYKYAMGIDHYIYGWVFFGIVIFILFAVGNTFSDRRHDTNEAPNIRWGKSDTNDHKGPIAVLALALICLISVSSVYKRASGTPHVSDEYAIPMVKSWRATNDKQLDLFGTFGGKPIQLQKQFESADKMSPVWMQMVLYLDLEQHGELENRANEIFDEEKWQRLRGPERIQTSIQNYPQVQELVLRRYGKEHLVWTWYEVEGEIINNRVAVKWALIKSRLAGSYRGGAQVMVVTPIINDVESARSQLVNFLSTVAPSMAKFRVTSADATP